MASLINASVDSRAETLSRDLFVDPAGDGSSQHSSLAGDVSSEPLPPAVPPGAPATPALSVPIEVQPPADPLNAAMLSALASIDARLEEHSVATASAVFELQERLVVFGGVKRSRFDVLTADLHEMKPIVRAQAGSFLHFGRQLSSLGNAANQSELDERLTEHTSLLFDLGDGRVDGTTVQPSARALGEAQAGVASVQQGLAAYVAGMQNVRDDHKRARHFAAASVALRSGGSRGQGADVPADRSEASAGDLGADMGLGFPPGNYCFPESNSWPGVVRIIVSYRLEGS